MNRHFTNYCWKNGKPYGEGVAESNSAISYKIVADPYYRRFTIEKYRCGKFERLIYDSQLIDFRKLKEESQPNWQRELLLDGELNKTFLLRDEEDRALLVETCTMEGGLCRSCTLHSTHGFLLSTHQIHYEPLGDTFSGVTLHDSENRLVMKKTYQLELETLEFTDLISEEWKF